MLERARLIPTRGGGIDPMPATRNDHRPLSSSELAGAGLTSEFSDTWVDVS